MTLPLRLALALLPLASYCFVLGAWHARSRPTVVPGPRDFGLLAFGLGGLVAFGPVGGALVLWMFPRESASAWLAVASLVGLLAMGGSLRARRRVVVYHAGPEELRSAVALAFEDVAGPPSPTPHGFQDGSGRRGVTIEASPRLGTGTVEAYGESPEALAEGLAPALADRLAPCPSRPSRLATVWFALGFAVMTFAGLTTALLTRPELRAAFRRIRGG